MILRLNEETHLFIVSLTTDQGLLGLVDYAIALNHLAGTDIEKIERELILLAGADNDASLTSIFWGPRSTDSNDGFVFQFAVVAFPVPFSELMPLVLEEFADDLNSRLMGQVNIGDVYAPERISEAIYFVMNPDDYVDGHNEAVEFIARK